MKRERVVLVAEETDHTVIERLADALGRLLANIAHFWRPVRSGNVLFVAARHAVDGSGAFFIAIRLCSHQPRQRSGRGSGNVEHLREFDLIHDRRKQLFRLRFQKVCDVEAVASTEFGHILASIVEIGGLSQLQHRNSVVVEMTVFVGHPARLSFFCLLPCTIMIHCNT